jgi:CRISPR-associated endonuclease Cas2
MQADEVRFVWLMVFFDLPVRTAPQRKLANRFRIFLKRDGYIMLQLSVYARLCRGQDAVDKHLRRVRSAPGHGQAVRKNGTPARDRAENRITRPRPDGPAVISAATKPRKSQQFQHVSPKPSYHWQIGRETTASP